MFKKFVLAVLLLSPLLVTVLVVRSSVLARASSLIIHVPDDYQTIQEAVDAANLGDIVLVSAGTYYEYVRVNKTISLIGENCETTIIDGKGNQTGYIHVTVDNMRISGFTIQNGAGVFLDHCSGCIIYANIIALNPYGGIWLNGSSTNIVSNNHMLNNGAFFPPMIVDGGIALTYSDSNIINSNWISNNIGGITLSSSDGNIVNHNTITNNSGIDLFDSSGNIVGNNVVTSNGHGIGLIDSAENTIIRNQVFKNKGYGIFVGESKNVIKENTVSKNSEGIKIHYSDGSIIHHNNFINNTENAPEDDYPNINTWDDGYPSGGNYWSDYNGTDLNSGPGQNVSGSDGIGDTPHTLDERNEDRFPLTGPLNFFEAGIWNETSYNIYATSNSTISNFQLNKTQKIVSFNVNGSDYTVGFCRIAIPNIIVQDLWQDNYTVLVDGNLPLMTNNWTDSTYTYMYFIYLHSEHEVVIITELPAAMVLPLFILITLHVAISTKKKNPKFAFFLNPPKLN